MPVFGPRPEDMGSFYLLFLEMLILGIQPPCWEERPKLLCRDVLLGEEPTARTVASQGRLTLEVIDQPQESSPGSSPEGQG